MSNLDKATTLSNVSNIANAEITFMKSHIGTILQNLVSLVSNQLMFLIKLLEVDRFTLGRNELPALWLHNRISCWQHWLIIFVKSNNSCCEDWLNQSQTVNNWTYDVISYFWEFNKAKLWLIDLYCYSFTIYTFHKPYYHKVAFI